MDGEPSHASNVPEPSPAPTSEPPLPILEPPHRWGLGAFVLVEFVYLLIANLFPFLILGDGRPSPSMLVALAAVPTVAAAGLAVFITKVRGNGPRVDLRLKWSIRDLGLGLVFGVGGFLFLTAPAAIVYVLIFGDGATSAVSAVFSGVRTSWTWAVVVFLLIAFVGPICEEIVYRGLLWGAVDWRWGRWAAFTVTTVVFALAHLEPERIPLLLVAAIPLGLARLYTGSLLSSIVAHQVTNLLPALLISLAMVGAMPAA
jgi:membrane protease YdiL (CAAX protease family)